VAVCHPQKFAKHLSLGKLQNVAKNSVQKSHGKIGQILKIILSNKN
jgi:hypothetical protein